MALSPIKLKGSCFCATFPNSMEVSRSELKKLLSEFSTNGLGPKPQLTQKTTLEAFPIDQLTTVVWYA